MKIHFNVILTNSIPKLKVVKAEHIDIEWLHDIVNEAYYTTEKDFWNEDYYRISIDQLSTLVKQESIFIAKENGLRIGCILFKELKKSTGTFSMLVTDPKHRKKGIGRALVAHVEAQAIELGLNKMELEILRPEDFIHEQKKFLKTWYESLGYVYQSSSLFKDREKSHVPFMKCELVFDKYIKNLK